MLVTLHSAQRGRVPIVALSLAFSLAFSVSLSLGRGALSLASSLALSLPISLALWALSLSRGAFSPASVPPGPVATC